MNYMLRVFFLVEMLVGLQNSATWAQGMIKPNNPNQSIGVGMENPYVKTHLSWSGDAGFGTRVQKGTRPIYLYEAHISNLHKLASMESFNSVLKLALEGRTTALGANNGVRVMGDDYNVEAQAGSVFSVWGQVNRQTDNVTSVAPNSVPAQEYSATVSQQNIALKFDLDGIDQDILQGFTGSAYIGAGQGDISIKNQPKYHLAKLFIVGGKIGLVLTVNPDTDMSDSIDSIYLEGNIDQVSHQGADLSKRFGGKLVVNFNKFLSENQAASKKYYSGISLGVQIDQENFNLNSTDVSPAPAISTHWHRSDLSVTVMLRFNFSVIKPQAVKAPSVY